jgi:diguanylate cyclase (GGDEF)-like protein
LKEEDLSETFGEEGVEGAIFPELRIDGRRPVVVMAARSAPIMTFGTTVLEAAGFEVIVESSGEAILGDLPKVRPDLILTEILLDDMDVVHFCARVRKLGAGKAVPILVVSDLPHAPTIRKVLDDDRTDFVSTPIQWHVLIFRAHRWISLARKLTVLQDREVKKEEVQEARDTAFEATTEALQLRHYDSLTGLPNRELFLNSVGLALSQQQRKGGQPLVLLLDIDNFREVNDLIGRTLGDELLTVVAERLGACLRRDDKSSPGQKANLGGSFARFTGDHFAVLIDTTEGKPVATGVANRLLEALSEPISIGEREFRLQGRVGIADSQDLDGANEEELVQRAETSMRYSKEKKGSRVTCFESFMNELAAQRLALTSELRTAIDKEQLFLTYQLLVEADTALPRGVEGLIRWQHPKRGIVPPNEFLPVAEESDLIVEIDRWVLRNGCRQGKSWLDAGLAPLKISLNVSMKFLEEVDFAEQVLAILEESGLPPQQLQLELSERGVLPEAGRIMPQLELLTSRRVQLAIDDFGTGQTSLSYLQTLPIHCVKVDRSFVSRVPDDKASAEIVSAVVAMSHRLGLLVVAEGVETKEQSSFLSDQDYDELQGFLFSKPERADSLEMKIRALVDDGRMERAGQRSEEVSDDVAGSVAGELERDESEEPPIVGGAEDPLHLLETEELQAPAAEDPPSEVDVGPTADSVEAPEPADDSLPSSPAKVEEPTEVTAGELEEAVEGYAAGPFPRAPAGSDATNQLLHLARRDFLTGLYNRFSFDERLEHAAAHADRFGHKLALLLIDLDDFKYVNDTYGHPVGDALLVAIARRVQKLVRKVDTLARIGGDEFAIIYSEFHEVESVSEFARRFLAVLSEPLEVEGRELRVNGSLGVTVYPEGDSRPKDLLRQADLALYKAKSLGGGRIHFFAQEMDRDMQRNLALARDLGGALERSEFLVKYQPVVDLRSGLIEGAEALLRWRHPSHGLVDAEKFIPVAESTGEIRALGNWVIQSACEQAKRWQKRSGREITVSVNISPVQCRDSAFAENVLRALDEHDLSPEILNMELSERLLATLPEDLEAPLRRLEGHGVGLTLDNFGSGSSALEHFKRFRFRRLKIDRSLLLTIGVGEESRDVLSGIVALAKKIDVQIVAGGIERAEEVARLLEEGCEMGQGFLFSKPLRGNLITELLLDGGRLRPDAAAGEGPDLKLIRGGPSAG